MVEGITQQNLKQPVSVQAFIFFTENLSCIQPYLLICSEITKTQIVLLVFCLIFLANIFSSFVAQSRLYEKNM